MACKLISTTDIRCETLQKTESGLLSFSTFILLAFFSFPFHFSLVAGLSHQPPDVSRVQPLRRRHGQLPVELQCGSARHGYTAGRGAAAQEQRAAIPGELRPHPPPGLHELRHRLSPEGECVL